jgi:hypothetical protein
MKKNNLYKAFIFNNETNNKFYLFEISNPIFSLDNKTFFYLIENIKLDQNYSSTETDKKNFTLSNNEANNSLLNLDLYTTNIDEVYLNRLKIYYLVMLSIISLTTIFWFIILYKRKNCVFDVQKILSVMSIYRILLTFTVIIYLVVTVESKNYLTLRNK